MKKYLWLLAILSLLLLNRSGALAAPSVETGLWVNYGTGTPGFPAGYPIVAAAVDGQERLWIGTLGGGIAVYDGIAWTRYTTNSGLVSNYVQSLTARGSTIWVATGAGVSVFSPPGTWTTYTTANGLPNNDVTAVAFRGFPFDSYLFATYDAGLAECSPVYPDDLSCSTYTTANSSIASNYLFDVAVAANGDRWIATGSGVNRVRGSTWTTYTNANTPGCNKIEEVASIAIDDRNGRIWFGLNAGAYDVDGYPGEGVCLFDTASSQWRHFHTGNSGLGDNDVTDVAVDPEGRAWFTTSPDPGGVYVCTWVGDTCYWQTYRTANSGLASNRLLAAAASLERMWFGTSDAGLSSFALYWQRFPDEVRALASLPGQLWVGTPAGLKSFDGAAWTVPVPGVDVRAVLALAPGDVWAGTFDNGAWRWDGSLWQQFYTGNSGLASNRVLALARDAAGRIWLGTADAGVSVYDPAAESWALFDAASVLPSDNVRALAVDLSGQVWVGTSSGLSRYSGTAWDTFTTANGLPSDAVNGLAVDSLGQVWAGTAGGAARWDGTAWTSYTAGLPNPYVRAVHADPAGPVWLGTLGGAAFFDGATWKAYRARNSGLLNERPQSIAGDVAGGVWFGAITEAGIPGGLFVRSPITKPLGLPAPVISGFSPTTGLASTIITITGANFDPTSPVYFTAKHGRVAAARLSGDDNTIQVRLPSAAMLGPIQVQTGSGTATSAASFNPIPRITSIRPITGVVGTPVRITGSNLTAPGLTEYRFGSGEWKSTATAYNGMTVTVPISATSGFVQVRTPGGVATSPAPFTVGAGGLTIFDWQVHQGLPSYPRVAGKSTLVRVFVGTNNPQGWCAFANRGALHVLRQGSSTPNVYFATVENGGIPNGGKFCNDELVYYEPASVDFVIPGVYLPSGKYYLSVSLMADWTTVASRELGWYGFPSTATGDLRLHISAPGLSRWNNEARSLFGMQLAALDRAYPVRDGVGSLGSANGVQYYLNTSYRVCDGTRMPHCKDRDGNPGTGFLWDYWQENSAGQARACTTWNTLDKAQDDGSVIRWEPVTVAKDKTKDWTFLARLRPGVTLPADPATLVSVTTTPGGLNANVSAQMAFSSPCGLVTSSQVIQFVVEYENTGNQDVSISLAVNYDQSRINTYGPGGLMLGSGSAFARYTVPGQFFVPEGSRGKKHDEPLDLNYNGIIDTTDLDEFVAEFEDWNPATGEWVVSTDLSRLDPFELIRNFRDANRNGKVDDGEELSMYLKRETTWKRVVYDAPLEYMLDHNKVASADAEFSGWWLWQALNPFDFRGLAGQASGDVTHWADLATTNVILHEMGHNMGLVTEDSPNYSGSGMHSKNQFIPAGAAGFDPVEQDDVTYMRSIMWNSAQSPLKDSFFEPFEYFKLYKRFRDQALVSTANVASGELQFYISGAIAENDEIAISHSYLTDDLAPTLSDAASVYSLRFLAGNALIREHRFPVGFNVGDPSPDDPQVDAVAFYIVQPFPAGATAVEIRRGSKTLFRREVSSTPPVVRLLAPNGGAAYAGDDELFVEWSGSDADGDRLTYAVRYSADGGATWHTLTAAGIGSQLSMPLATLPGGQAVLVEVEASDGFHTASDRSDAPFSVGAKPPLWAAIVAPSQGDSLVQSQLVNLVGSGYDLEDGALSGEALTWSSNRMGVLGSGEKISATLTVGEHLITLTARDSNGLTATNAITVAVLSDFDRDGLADEYEQRYAALNWWNAEDAGADADSDGLTNLGEAAWGTDPTIPDSDGDSVPDGEELSGGSFPTDPDSRPSPPELLISATGLNFVATVGGPGTLSEELLLISSAPQPLAWTVETDVPWLSVEPISGTTPAVVAVSVDVTGWILGDYQGHLTFRSSNTRVIPVHVAIQRKNAVYLPLILR